MQITKDNYKEIFFALQDELNISELNMEDWIMVDFMYYIFGNKDETAYDESLFQVYENVKKKIFINEYREEKINQILNG